MDSTITRIRRVGGAILIVCFLVGIWLPLGNTLFGPSPASSITEKRTLAPRPRLTADYQELREYPKNYEAYYNDVFGFRSSLIRVHNVLKAKGLRTSPTDDVVFGKEGWLYMGIQGAIDQHRAINPMPPKLLRAWQRRFEECYDYCDDRGVPFLFIVAPNKVSIYPEYLPDSVERIGKETRLDQLGRHIEKHSYVPLLDLRPALLEAKEKELVYRVYDGHWNEVGAFAAYRSIIQELRKDFPGIPLLAEDDFTRRIKTMPGGDITHLMALPDLYEEDIVILDPKVPYPYRAVTDGMVDASTPWEDQNQDRLMAGERTRPIGTEIDDPERPRMVMYRDSFATNVIGHLSHGFSRVVYYWQYFFDPEIIIAETPDIVTQQIIERVLMQERLPPNPEKIRIDFERRRRFRASDSVLFAASDLERLVERDGSLDAFFPETGITVHVRRSPEGAHSYHLPLAALPENSTALVRLALETEAPTTCRVSRPRDDDPEGAGEEPTTRSLSPGLEIIYAELAGSADGRHVRVELLGAGEITIRDLEIRAVPRPPRE